MNRPDLSEEAIFDQAIDKKPEDRSAFLTRVCNGDSELRGRVEGLLLAHETPDSLLDQPLPELVVNDGAELNVATIGARIGPYKLLEQIGEGGFGVVYLAQQQYPVRRDVALKIIKPGMDTKQVIARFEAERQALALMDHPHIAKVLEAGATETGQPYFVMELVKGVPITEYCDQCQLSILERLGLFAAVCEAVQHAHQKGIIHRDIKPTNVLIAITDGRPSPKIIDFGVAKATHQRLTEKTLRTGFAQMLGTPMYMSPEQAEMSALDVDTRTDIYALGVLLYELLTGTTPFEPGRLNEASFDEIRRVIRDEDPPRPSTRMSTLTNQSSSVAEHRRTDLRKLTLLIRGELDWIVMKALEKDRTRRYETASALSKDINRFLNEEAVEACPPSVGYRLRKLYRRNKLIFSTVVVISTTVLIATGISIWLAVRATQAEATAQRRFEQEQKAHMAADAARLLEAQQRRLAERRLLESHMSEARALRRDGTAGRRFQSLTRVREAAELARTLQVEDQVILQLRSEAIASLALLDLRPESNWPGLAPRDSHNRIGLDRALEHYARIEPDGFVVVRRMSDNQEVVRVPGLGSLQVRPELCFSPDGQLLALRAGSPQTGVSEIRVWLLDGGRVAQPELVLETTAGGESWGSVIDFSPTGTTLATVASNGPVCLFDTRTGQLKKQLALPVARIPRCIRFHPRGGKLAVGSESSVSILETNTGNEVASFPQADLRSLAWSPDGRYLAVGGGNRKITIWDTELATIRAECHGHDASVIHVAYNHAGDLLVSWSWDGSTRIWSARSGQLLLTTTGRGVQFSDDDRLLGFARAGERIGRRFVDQSRALRVLNTHDSTHTVVGIDFSPDGRMLVSGTDRDGVRIWNVQAETEIEHMSMVRRAMFDSGGGRLFTAGPAGFAAWDIERDAADSTLNVGFAKQLLTTDGTGGRFQDEAALTRDQNTLAVTESYGKLAFIDLANAEIKRRINATGYLDVSISPDGHWAAAAPWNSFSSINIWDLETGEVEAHLPLPNSQSGVVSFSPDGKWLVANDGVHYTFWSVGTWQDRHVLPGDGPIAFTATGNQFAITREGLIHLHDSASLQELARLEAPYPQFITALGLSPNGTMLAAGTPTGTVQLWNLRYVRQQLAELGLDWSAPPFPPEKQKAARNLQIKFDFGDQWQLWYGHATGLAAAGNWQEAIASYAQAIQLAQIKIQEMQPTERARWNELQNSFAWMLSTCPQVDLRDGAQAVQLAKQAVELAPESSHFWNTLGAAHIQADEWNEAVSALEKSMTLRAGGDSFDWFLLAMAHWHLGSQDEARRWYVKSVRWMNENKPDDRELMRFRTEAGKVMQPEEHHKP